MALTRKPAPADEARELVDATRARDAAEERWELAVVAALRAGASMRQIAGLAACSHSTIERLAKKHGWPDPAERRKRAAEAAQRAAWRTEFDAYLASGGAEPSP